MIGTTVTSICSHITWRRMKEGWMSNVMSSRVGRDLGRREPMMADHQDCWYAWPWGQTLSYDNFHGESVEQY